MVITIINLPHDKHHDQALRLDQDYLAERFPDGPPREIFQLPPGIEMMMGPLMMGGGMPTFDDAPAPIQALFSQFMEAMASGQGACTRALLLSGGGGLKSSC